MGSPDNMGYPAYPTITATPFGDGGGSWDRSDFADQSVSAVFPGVAEPSAVYGMFFQRNPRKGGGFHGISHFCIPRVQSEVQSVPPLCMPQGTVAAAKGYPISGPATQRRSRMFLTLNDHAGTTLPTRQSTVGVEGRSLQQVHWKHTPKHLDGKQGTRSHPIHGQKQE